MPLIGRPPALMRANFLKAVVEDTVFIVESGKSLLINEAILTQNICAEALKKAKSR